MPSDLDDDDRLGWVKMTHGEQDLILVSEQGKGIRFSEEDVRPMGRTATGVNAMRIDAWDRLTGADVVTPDGHLFLITENGYGKRTPLSEYRTQNRYGQGVKAMTLLPSARARSWRRGWWSGDEVTLISTNGIILRTGADLISQQGRSSQGVRIMDIRNTDSVASLAIVRVDQQIPEEADGATPPEAGNGDERGMVEVVEMVEEAGPPDDVSPSDNGASVVE